MLALTGEPENRAGGEPFPFVTPRFPRSELPLFWRGPYVRAAPQRKFLHPCPLGQASSPTTIGVCVSCASDKSASCENSNGRAKLIATQFDILAARWRKQAIALIDLRDRNREDDA